MAKGIEFEKRALEYLRFLFEQLGFTVTEARQQRTGTQNGFDIRIGFLDDKKKERKFYFECKDYTTEISWKEISIKILELHSSSHHADGYIALSPHVNFTNIHINVIDKLVQTMQAPVKYWTPETYVQEYFSLDDAFFKFLYGNKVLPVKKNKALILQNIRAIIVGMLRQKDEMAMLYADKPILKGPTVSKMATSDRQTAHIKPKVKIIQLTSSLLKYEGSAFSFDGKYLISSGVDGIIRLWDIQTERCSQLMHGHEWGWIHEIMWSSNQQFILSASYDKTVRLWEMETGNCLRTFKHSQMVWSVEWSPDDTLALSGDYNGVIRLWDVKTGQCLNTFAGHTENVTRIAWGTDQKYILTASNDKTIRLWDWKNASCIRVFQGHSGQVYDVIWSPDNSRALSGSYDETIRLWEIATGKCLCIMEGDRHGGWIGHVAWNKINPHLVLSGSCYGTIQLWNVETGRCLLTSKDHRVNIEALAWSNDGYHALSFDGKGRIRIWDLSEFIN